MWPAHANPGRRLNDIQIDLMETLNQQDIVETQMVHLLSLAVENNRGLIGLADLLKNGCLARVGSPDDENAEATGFLAKLLGTGVLIAIDDG